MGLTSSLAGATAGMGGLGKGALRATAGMVGFTAAAGAGAIALREIIVGSAQFEQEMDVLQVVTGATATEMERIGAAATALGADITLPGTSAGDAAVAMNELAKAGLSVTNTLGGARGALQLAAAGEIEVGQAAALAGSALNVFGLAGTEATHVADLLAGASIVAQGEVGDMALALQQSGAVARQAGLSLEQTVGAIGLLAKNGILGSDAGTSLRTTLLRLIPTTKEAQQFTQALGISIDETRSLGEQLPEVIEQYRQALSKLNPTLQQQALTQIFGTDAIRAASIFAREGAAGYEAMTAAVDRNGAANELATARTKGLAGTFDGLKSQLSTLALELGQLVVPALTQFTQTLSETVGAVTSVVTAIKGIGDVELPNWLDPTDTSVGEALGLGVKGFVKSLTPGITAVKLINGALRDTDDEIKSVVRDARTVSDVAAQSGADAIAGGRGVGQKFGQGVAGGIQDTAALAVASARATVAAVAAQGQASVAQAIAGAQQNLASIGSSLASDAATIIDSGVTEGVSRASSGANAAVSAGQRKRQQDAIKKAEQELNLAIKNIPIMREIERLQGQLDRSNQADDARDVRRGVRDAQEALAAAQRQAQTAGPLDARQQKATGQFLRPFKEELQDAKAEAKKFNVETRLDTLQKRLEKQTDDITENIANLRESLQSAREALVQSQSSFSTGGLTTSLKSAATAQKEAVTRGINDAIQAFNDGLITLPQLNRRLAKVLEDNGVDYKNAGGKLGTAFVRGFEEKLKGVGVQASDILGGPQDPGAGLRPTSVQPGAALRTATLNNEQAQRALTEALVDQNTEANSFLKRIADAVEGRRPDGRPASAVGDSAADKADVSSPSSPAAPAKPPRRRDATPPTAPYRPGRRSGP